MFQQKNRWDKSLGYGFGIMYCVITALSIIYIQYINQSINPILSTLVTFVFSMLWFNFYNLRALPFLYQVCWQHKKRWLAINLWTAMIWIGTFYALTYINPVLYITLFMGLMPTMTYAIAWARGLEKYAFKHIGFGAAVIIAVITLMIDSAWINHQETGSLLLGCLYTLIAVIGAALYLLDAKALQEQGQLSSSQMLALRFFALIIIAFLGAILNHSIHLIAHLPYAKLCLLAVLTSILPMYCLQVSLQKMGAVKFSFIMPFTPIFTYLLLLCFGAPMHWSILLILLFLGILLIGYSKVKQSKK